MGSPHYPEIQGNVSFTQIPVGVLVSVSARGLPMEDALCREPVFALHIHEGTSCTGRGEDPFGEAGTHYNPKQYPHPFHDGDLPPLFGSDGLGYSVCLSNRFSLDEILGQTVILHRSLDDFTSQPAGTAGEKMACGKILPTHY